MILPKHKQNNPLDNMGSVLSKAIHRMRQIDKSALATIVDPTIRNVVAERDLISRKSIADQAFHSANEFMDSQRSDES